MSSLVVEYLNRSAIVCLNKYSTETLVSLFSVAGDWGGALGGGEGGRDGGFATFGGSLLSRFISGHKFLRLLSLLSECHYFIEVYGKNGLLMPYATPGRDTSYN